jgi:Ca2+-binding RTX toxin-like protein
MAEAQETDETQTVHILSSLYFSGIASLFDLDGNPSFTLWSDKDLTFKFNKNVKSPDHELAFTWNENYSLAVQTIFTNLSHVSGLRFSEVDHDADIDFWFYHSDDNVYGYSYGVGGSGVFLNASNLIDIAIPVNGYDFLTIAHEIVHNLGISHPFDGYANFPEVSSPLDIGKQSANQNIYTITSYNDTGTTSKEGIEINPPYRTGQLDFGLSSLGTIDQSFLQILYGENENNNNDDNVYILDGNRLGAPWTTIWDTGGVDTIEIQSTSIEDAYINLQPANFQTNSETVNLGGISTILGTDYLGGYLIGENVRIENASTGLGNDTIIGNQYSNHITSEGGNNTIKTKNGNNFVELGDGNDIVKLSANGVWSDAYFAKNTAQIHINSTSEKIPLSGLNKYTDQVFTGDGFDEIHLSDQNDAFFLDDQFSDVFQTKFETGQDYKDLKERIIGVDKIHSGEGDDLLDMTSGAIKQSNIELVGGDGNDVIWAGTGNDILIGGSGDDQLNGGSGDDLLNGGSGENIFSFAGNFGDDVIQDWTYGTNYLKIYNTNEVTPTIDDNVVSFGSFGTITFQNTDFDLVAQINFELA